MFTAQISFKPSPSRSLRLASCPSAELRSGDISWKWPLVSLVPVTLASRLLLHGVLDGPPLPRAGLQDQQVAEVNVSRHHLQTASRGSIYDRFVLQGRRRDSVLVSWGFTVYHTWVVCSNCEKWMQKKKTPLQKLHGTWTDIWHFNIIKSLAHYFWDISTIAINKTIAGKQQPASTGLFTAFHAVWHRIDVAEGLLCSLCELWALPVQIQLKRFGS